MSRSCLIIWPFFRYVHYSLKQVTYNSHCHFNTHRNFVLPLIQFSNKTGQYYSRLCFSCWHCNAEYQPFRYFCPKCTKIQKPSDSVTYFELFNLSKCFDVNVERLSEQFRSIQSQLHPDKFNLKDAFEQNLSSEYSSLVNKAYSTLMNPLIRALYMLELKDIVIEDKTEMDNKFLMEIMEINEVIDEADSSKLVDLEEQNKTRLAKFYSDLSLAFKADNLNKAKELVLKIKYFVSIENRIKEIKMKALG